MQYKALNPVVLERLKNDFELYLVWDIGIDDDIDPTHNKDWVKSQKEFELRVMGELLEKIAARKNEWGKMPR